MGIFFGTDGIRGVAMEELSFDLAYKCGNALSSTKEKPTIIIGRDTRISGSLLTLAFAGGAMCGGANIVDIGICTTPAVAYITKKLKADYGVMISASHNPKEYNGIKIFNSNGYKLSDAEENALERRFVKLYSVSANNVGSYVLKSEYVNLYINHIKKLCPTYLNGLKIVIDASNGGAYSIAPKVFKILGAEVICLSCKNDGVNINNNCGSLHPENLKNEIIKNNANIGFAYDGDADRIIACDEKGNILDGDILTYILANHLKKQGKLNCNTVVGTRHTNMGLEVALNENDIKLIRTDIGDKYVLAQMLKSNLSLGGEKSGHIILSSHATTGDGVLISVLLATIVKVDGKSLGNLSNVSLYPQANIDVEVLDKMRVINSEKLSNIILEQENILPKDSRIMVRMSGTEPKIRIMVEGQDEVLIAKSANKIKDTIKQIDGGNLCAE